MMNRQRDYENEASAALAFSRQSEVFDALYTDDLIIQYKRDRVHNHLLEYLRPNSTILELNAGTGEDAVYFAEKDHAVHATDIATGMQEKLRQKAAAHQLTDRITSEVCSFTSLTQLKNKGPFDCIFSNFAGLNCTGELDKILLSFDDLLKPGGIVTLVVLPRFCLWETLLIFKGKFKLATRRFFSHNGRQANIEGCKFTCWYYSPSTITKCLKGQFDLLALEGLCSFVPPSYMENFPVKHPRLFHFLKQMESRYKNSWPWNLVGDYYIITLRKKNG